MLSPEAKRVAEECAGAAGLELDVWVSRAVLYAGQQTAMAFIVHGIRERVNSGEVKLDLGAQE